MHVTRRTSSAFRSVATETNPENVADFMAAIADRARQDRDFADLLHRAGVIGTKAAAVNVAPPRPDEDVQFSADGQRWHRGADGMMYNDDETFGYDQIGTSGQKACLWVLHSQTSGTAIDGRRTRIEGLTVQGNGASNCHGILINAPATLSDVDSKGHGLSGIVNMADAFNAGSAPIPGNANGTQFINCISQQNGGSGFYLLGDNANACLLLGCKAPANGEYGFYDNSLLGTTYVACEADANGIAGFWENPNKPVRNTHVGNYSETPGHFSANPRSLRLNTQGLFKEARSFGGTGIYPLASSDCYITQAVVFAITDDIANTVGATPFAGAAMRISEEGINYMPRAGALRIQMNDVLSPSNYVDWVSGGSPVLRLPKRRVAGNIDPTRQHMPEGFTVGGSGKSGIVGAGSAPPTSGSYDAGALWLNDAPAPGGYVGWVCTTAGIPGVWRTFGSISNA